MPFGGEEVERAARTGKECKAIHPLSSYNHPATPPLLYLLEVLHYPTDVMHPPPQRLRLWQICPKGKMPFLQHRKTTPKEIR